LASLKGSTTCRYEISADSHFIAGPHPDHGGAVWLVGGGSGHGFEHGSAMAERIVDAWAGGGAPLPARFALRERSAGSNLTA
jgi:glycine/D-amino acid oxidase-like deaminating enzyme